MDMAAHLHVLVTRPSPSGEVLCEMIRLAGNEATHFSTIAFAPPKDESALLRAVEKLDSQDWLIFISPQAVYSSMAMMRRVWPHLPEKLAFAAVGAGTAKALQKAGITTVTYPRDEWSSEGLLSMPVFQNVKGKNISIVRGEGGREILDKILVSRGANVSHMIAYQRVLPTVDVVPCRNLFTRQAIDVVVCSSYEAVHNLKILLGDEAWPQIKNIPLIVMSERIKTLALNLGFQTIWVAAQASHEAILAMLAQKKDELRQIKKAKQKEM
jgi:uroporphyrinogen-III synthase